MTPLSPLSRRTLIAAGLGATVSLASPTARAAGEADARRKLVVVILRGGLDGLAVLPKLDDPDIDGLRAALIDREAAPLADGFALHSAMPGLLALWRAGEAAFAPAVAGPYRERSHFEAQDLLESGGATQVYRDGWLNRALQKAPRKLAAVSIGPVQPLVLRGPAEASSWSPSVLPEAGEDTLRRLSDLYEGDAILAPALARAIEADAVASGGDMADGGGRGQRAGQAYAAALSAAGSFLAAPDGPAVAVVSLDGWDTHAGQPVALRTRLQAFDTGLSRLKAELGPLWETTVVVAASEFGRTVRVNGAVGSDHGTGGAAYLAGGALRSARMLGDWPGLKPAALYENRDLAPTLDMRSLFKGVLRDHLGWDAKDLDRHVFPDSAGAPALQGLV